MGAVLPTAPVKGSRRRWAALLVLVALGACARPSAPSAMDTAVDGHGAIHVPADYRTTYAGLGTFAVAADHGPGAKQLHVVYTQPATIAAYRTTGHYPDGTVLVKEVYDTVTAPQTTGTVSHASALKGWFVMVRDSRDTHRSDPHWGDGWGWSWFDAKDPNHTTTTDYRSDCLGCHEPARATELSYVQGYPVLRR